MHPPQRHLNKATIRERIYKLPYILPGTIYLPLSHTSEIMTDRYFQFGYLYKTTLVIFRIKITSYEYAVVYPLYSDAAEPLNRAGIPLEGSAMPATTYSPDHQ